MKRLILSVFSLTFFVFQLAAQDVASGCDGIRYISEPFTEVDKTTVLFGENINGTGQLQSLYMDVYQPVGDTVSQRPAFVWAYGGGFIGGSRADMEETCIEFARRGFVTVAFDYRLYSITQGFPDSTSTIDIIVKAMHDMKAAVRHLRQDAATDNNYNIDPERILVGGVSAGGITAMHAAYLDVDDDIPAHFQDALDANGGMEGTSGDADNLSYSSEVQFVISLSGALYTRDWIDADEAPMVTIHGTADEIVPYEHDFLSIDFGVVYYFNSIDGSGVLHPVLDDLGIPNLHVPVPGGMHENIYFDAEYESYRETFTVDGALLLYDYLCPDVPIVVINSVQEQALEEVRLYPNPAATALNVQISPGLGNYRAEVFDMLGRQLGTWNDLNGSWQIDPLNLVSGQYVLRLQGDGWQSSRVFVVR
ncbi:MAG: alpha/beta hydrolase fold domain-containing protein [Bacteroidetes bacterium]|nr:alpha/beta hydrolase fold domain-containing protein [Bacteroidota bacterium]